MEINTINKHKNKHSAKAVDMNQVNSQKFLHLQDTQVCSETKNEVLVINDLFGFLLLSHEQPPANKVYKIIFSKFRTSLNAFLAKHDHRLTCSYDTVFTFSLFKCTSNLN